MDKKIEEILQFWFDYDSYAATLYERAIWWQKNADFDRKIKEKFNPIWEEIIHGNLTHWLNTPKGTLAYIIVIDQFSRNMWRHSPQMYQYDSLALSAAKQALQKEFQKQLLPVEQIFLYMPFEHSEDLVDQTQSVHLFTALKEAAPLAAKNLAQNYLEYAHQHYAIIAKFHRFPHRNKILGRQNTPEEALFLQTHAGF